MRKGNWFDLVAIPLIVLLMLVSAFATYMAGDTRKEFREKCERAGGITYKPRGRQICLRKESVIYE